MPRDTGDGGQSAARRTEVSGKTRLAPDILLLAVSLAAGLGLARLTDQPGAARVLGPVAAVVVTGHLATMITRRLRAPLAVASGTGIVTVALATVWGQLLSSTRYGFPTATTWRVFLNRLDDAGTAIRSNPTPVPATSGVVLCLALGAGIAAVLAATLWLWQETRLPGRANRSPRPLVALVPAFGLFCYTSLLSSQVDRIQGAIAFVASALAFVIAADRPVLAGGRRAPASAESERPDRVASRGRLTGLLTRAGALGPSLLVAGLAVGAVGAVSPGLSSLRVDALPFSQGRNPGGGFGAFSTGGGLGGGGVGFGPGPFSGASNLPGLRAIDLADDMRAVLTNRTNELMFSATSPVPTYWQLAVLTRFDGRRWLPDATTQAAIEALVVPTPDRSVPGLPVLPEPRPSTTFRSTITIAGLQTTLLPLPPRAVSVEGIGSKVVPGFGALVPFEASPYATYWADASLPPESRQARAPSRPAGSPSGVTTTSVPVPDRSSLEPYLALPPVPSQVVQLAHQIVAGTNGPAAKATALVRWFDSGRFRYTLTPPDTANANPVQSFLFSTRQGFCQQFAAAYAVLARIDDLPARVAVGFTTGSVLDGRYRVTGADAHVWPEVYLGPSVGWTSFEPTPSASGEPNGVGVFTGSRSNSPSAAGGANVASTLTLPTHRGAQFHSTPVTTAPLVLPQGRAAASSRSTGSSGVLDALVTLALVIGVGGAIVFLWVLRRIVYPPHRRRRLPRIRRRRGSSDPTAEVLAQWRDAQRVLERSRLGRRPAETLHEHAARLESLAHGEWLAYAPAVLTVRAGDGEGGNTASDARHSVTTAVGAYRRLADLATRASYASDPCSASDASDAEELSTAVRTGLSRPVRRARAPVHT